MGQASRSIRDPMSTVLVTGDKVIRGIRSDLQPQTEALLESDFFRRNEGANLIGTRPISADAIAPLVDDLHLDFDRFPLWLEHERLPLISYSYEWGFSSLKRAAMLHLQLLGDALASGFVTADGSSANVQFRAGRPVFIDIGSIRRHQPRQPWFGYRQFCEQFLAPLLLNSHLAAPHQKIFQGSLDAVSLDGLSRMLPASTWLSPSIFGHVHLYAMSSRRARSAAVEPTRTPAIDTARLIALVQQLHRFIDGLRPKGRSEWMDYASKNSYPTTAAADKRQIVHEFVAKNGLKRVLDVGCNTGDYSEVCFDAGADEVVGVDSDPQVIDAAVNKPSLSRRNFTGLVHDIADPAPAGGWAQAERKSLNQRLPKFDGVVCLALIHHAVISGNVPVDEFIKLLCALAPTGLLEFVPPEDPMVKRLMQRRMGCVHDYGESVVKDSLSRRAVIEAEHRLDSSGRMLFVYRTK
jgi:SAM-dependent methyltransferase